ncbi:MAG: EAL domain-containing protein [Pseudomonadota bacterium]
MDKEKALFQGLFEASPDALIVVDGDGKIILANRQTEKAFEYERAELIGQTIECLVPERLRSDHLKQRLLFQKAPHQRPMGGALTLCGRRKDGSEFSVDILLSPIESEEGTLVLAAIRDITERNRVQAALHEERERSRITLESIGDAVLCTDTEGKIQYLNKVAEEMTAWPSSKALGQPLTRVFQLVEDNSRDTVPLTLELALSEKFGKSLTRHSVLIRADDKEVSIKYTVAPISDAAGKTIGVVIVFSDISQTLEFTRQMAYLAQHDFLTNLPNRMLLNDRLTQAIGLANRSHTQLAVLFLDLDHFKYINDSLGHGIGDRLLQSVAQRLVACVRSSDTVSRNGGDEFVILLAEIEHLEDARISAEKIIAALNDPHQISGYTLQVSPSIGISVYPNHGQNAETLIKNADLAMYHAKDSGRNNVQFFTPDLTLRSVERQSVESDLRLALERREFDLYYQPKVDLTSGATIGAEALLRWRHPERGLISPAHFIAIAEDSGLIIPIGRWVMRSACRQMQIWRQSGVPRVPVSVNVSALEFRSPHFLDEVRTILAETQVEPAFLELELTESVLMQHAEATIGVLTELKRIGVRLTIDDFGTGYSSLSYLSYFPIDTLKIDQSFVHEITTHAYNAAIVSAVIGMCEGLRREVIAEGVETPEQAAFLLGQHCPHVQGYYCSPPIPAADFVQYLGLGGRRTALVLAPACEPSENRRRFQRRRMVR